jgi:hypothetical protein
MEISILLIILAVLAVGFIVWKVFMPSDKEESTKIDTMAEECGCDECECGASKPIEYGVDIHYGIDATAEITRILSEEISKAGGDGVNFKIPVGGVSEEDAKSSLEKMISQYKEEIEIPTIGVKLETVEVKSGTIEIPVAEEKKTPVRKKKPYKKRKKSEFPIKPTEPVEAAKPKSKRGRKPKNKGGDKDQLLLS